MNPHYLTSNGQVLEVNVEGDTHLTVKAFSLDCKSWELTNISEFSWSCKVKVELLHTSEIVESSTCHRIPIALVALTDCKHGNGKDFECYLIHLNVKAAKCTPLKKLSVPICELEKVCRSKRVENFSPNFMLIDGPSVLLCRNSEVTMCWWGEGKTLMNVSSELLLKCSKECASLEMLSEVLHCHCLFRRKIIFIHTLITKACEHCFRKDEQDLTVLEFRDEAFTKLDPTLFLPKEFHEALSSVNMCDIKVENSFVISTEIYASTNNGFILWIQNAHLMKCISIHDNFYGFTKDIYIQCVEIDDKHYVIVKQDNKFVILDQHLKVHKEYTDMQCILFGDFICNGTIQCLFTRSPNITSSEWTLDDFDQLSITSTDKSTPYSENSVDSPFTATKALQSRLQQERLLHQKLQHDLNKKKEFLREMVLNRLQCPNVCESPCSKQKISLLPLIEGQIDGVKDTAIPSVTGSQSTVYVCGVWQRTMGHKWCIGVEFSWKSNHSAEIWLQAVPYKNVNNPVVTRSTRVICKSESSSDQPVESDTCTQSKKGEKRQKMEAFSLDESDDSFFIDPKVYTVTCVTDTPQFFQNSVTVCLMLKWKYLNASLGDLDSDINGELINDNLLDFSNEKVLTQNCGELTLNCGDVINGKYDISTKVECDSGDIDMDNYKDLSRSKLAWKAIQTLTELTVHSSAGVLAELEQLLVQRCNFVYNHHFQCYITAVRPLSAIQLELLPSTTDASREMRVYTGSGRELFLLLHHLYDCLPDNIVALPNSKNRKRLQEILPSIQQEASFYSDGIRKLLDDHDRMMCGDIENECDQTTDVRKIGERFKRKREEFVQKEKETVDVSVMEDFLQKLNLYQQKTDSLIATEIS